MELKKMQDISEEYIAKFIKAATELVMDEVTNTDEENKKKIIMCTARDMAIGALMKRNEHILTGVGIGTLGTTLIFAISSKFKKQKDVTVVFDMDTMKTTIKEDDEVFEEAFEETSATEYDMNDLDYDEVEVKKESIMDRVNDILKKPSNLEDIKAVIEELEQNGK